MNDYREYCIAIAAIFLALALGILIGISFGEDFLVSNQQEIIELMEQELRRSREAIREKELELERWERVKPVIRRSYQDRLSGLELALIAPRAEDAAALQAILSDTGAEIAFRQPAQLTVEHSEEAEQSMDSACYILLMQKNSAGSGWDPEMMALWRALAQEGKRVIAVFPWGELKLPPLAEGIAWNLVDNINTYWGELALLEMIASGAGGHYGFDGAASGLMPPLE
ncbi:MAG: copper transporter [Firmicutes bacterium]|nr:copper transporter [Bacillota bacterium]